jgi:5S rRNA maturation endonuclease (ribonuclease M5)
MSNQIKMLRNNMSPEQILTILSKYDVQPVQINDLYMLFPTVCHNLNGGSNKMYYYKKDHIFKCYTECNGIFDIFTLIQKMQVLRNAPVSLPQAMNIAGVGSGETSKMDFEAVREVMEDLDKVTKMNRITTSETYVPEILNESQIMRAFTYSLDSLKPWIEEGITPQTLSRYGIKYDPAENAIFIPHYDAEGSLVGVRGRYMSPDAHAKYMPIQFNGKRLAHKTSRLLYGLHISKEAIMKHKTAIIFEGEKSCMKMDSIYGENNISVAVSGKTITIDHIKALVKLGVKQVILAFDRDYESFEEIIEKRKEYTELVSYIQNFCNVSMILDHDLKLGLKDSPIDAGKEVFEELMKDKINL